MFIFFLLAYIKKLKVIQSMTVYEPCHKSLVIRKPAFCICENKDADQLRGDREADQRLCFRYTDSTIPLLPKSEISSLSQFSVAAQLGLYQTWSETRRPVFSQEDLYSS